MSPGEPGTRRPWAAALAVAAATVAAVLAFAVFEVQTLFVDEEVSEAGPAFEDPAGAGATEPTARGTFVAVEHPGQGSVVVLTRGTQSFVRLEDDFATDNGPDLHVTVTVDGRTVQLGRLKGNIGAQNYELPAEIDASAVRQVSIWCKRFDATFTRATLR